MQCYFLEHARNCHTPTEVSEGTTFTAWIDVENDVESVTFYVCTLEEPHTCYKPQKMLKNESQNGRFQFEYLVKSNDYPGYKYELENKIILQRKYLQANIVITKGLEVEKMGDSYYFKVNVEIEESPDGAREGLFRGYWIYAVVMTLGFIFFALKR